jgi:hypothetical protein
MNMIILSQLQLLNVQLTNKHKNSNMMDVFECFSFPAFVLLTRNDCEYEDIVHPLKNDDIVHFSFKTV